MLHGKEKKEPPPPTRGFRGESSPQADLLHMYIRQIIREERKRKRKSIVIHNRRIVAGGENSPKEIEN